MIYPQDSHLSPHTVHVFSCLVCPEASWAVLHLTQNSWQRQSDAVDTQWSRLPLPFPPISLLLPTPLFSSIISPHLSPFSILASLNSQQSLFPAEAAYEKPEIYQMSSIKRCSL